MQLKRGRERFEAFDVGIRSSTLAIREPRTTETDFSERKSMYYAKKARNKVYAKNIYIWS